MLEKSESFWLEFRFRLLARAEHVLVLLFVARWPDGCRVADVAREFLGVPRGKVIKVLEALVDSDWLLNRADVVRVDREAVLSNQMLFVRGVGYEPAPSPAISLGLLLSELAVLGHDLDATLLAARGLPNLGQTAALFNFLAGQGEPVLALSDEAELPAAWSATRNQSLLEGSVGKRG